MNAFDRSTAERPDSLRGFALFRARRPRLPFPVNYVTKTVFSLFYILLLTSCLRAQDSKLFRLFFFGPVDHCFHFPATGQGNVAFLIRLILSHSAFITILIAIAGYC